MEIENAEHFFIRCPIFGNERITLFNETHNFHPLILNTLTHGSDILSQKITYAFLKLSISLSIIHIDFPKIDDSTAPKLSTTDTLFRHHSIFIYLFIYLLAHLSQRLIGELIVYQWSGVCRPSVVVHNAQRSSSPKPLVRSKPNFMWSLLGSGGTIFCSRHLGRFSRNLVCSIWDSSPS